MRTPPLTAIVLTALLVGCLAPEAHVVDPPAPSVHALQSLWGAVDANEPQVWKGASLSAQREAPCPSGACEVIPIRVNVPADHWRTHEGGLQVVATWDAFHLDEVGAHVSLAVVDRLGDRVATGQGASRATVAFLPEPAPGPYALEVRAQSGTGPYAASLVLVERPRSDAAREILPDLVMMPIGDLGVSDAGWAPRPDPLDPLVDGRGCDAWEYVEQDARRCLRFSTAVGNAGQGPLEVRLDSADGLLAIAGGSARFVQRIHASDGSWRDEPVGAATFHPVHLHYHYPGLAEFSLYAYDLGAGSRLERVSDHSKAGFCFHDMGVVALDRFPVDPPRFGTDANCLVAEPNADWVTGVSAGWFDLYASTLSDQYVDVSHLGDGVYELVARAGDGLLVETDPGNNEASVVFRMQGDDVDVLFSPSHPSS